MQLRGAQIEGVWLPGRQFCKEAPNIVGYFRVTLPTPGILCTAGGTAVKGNIRAPIGVELMSFSHRLLMTELLAFRRRVASEEGERNSESDWREWRRGGCAVCDQGQLGSRWRL
jgi:hypothetical protein